MITVTIDLPDTVFSALRRLQASAWHSGKGVNTGELAPDNKLIDLCRTVGNRQQPGISKVSFHGKFPGYAECAVDLNGL